MISRNPDSRRPHSTESASSPAEQVLAHAQAGREVVQEFVALADSLEWELGQRYLRQRGYKAFLSDSSPVPFVVNNDGSLSRNAADVFFTSLVAAEQAGQLEDEIFVLELGIGVCLFARYVLDHFRDLCCKRRKDYYHRLTYIAADRSERMLHDVLRHGVLGDHPGRYRVRQVDAMQPETLLRDVGMRDAGVVATSGSLVGLGQAGTSGASEPLAATAGAVVATSGSLVGLGQAGTSGASEPVAGTSRASEPLAATARPFRAVFLNYLLDCLPAAVLELEGEKTRQLCVRTCVGRNVRLADYTDLTPQQLRERAKSDDARDKEELLEVYGLFASEYDYRAVDPRTLPHGAFAAEYGRTRTKRLLHSYGAMQCLEKLLPMLADGGFILVNDYGQTQITRDDEFEHQRFSLATFVGVNFALLREYFGEGKRCQYIEPAGEEGRGIHARLLGTKVHHEVHSRFSEAFGEAAHQRLQEPIQKARACGKAGRFELAAGFYREALRLQPRNWVLLCEVSQFLTFQLRQPKDGADMAKVALRLNPTCSAELWNALGDALYEFGHTEEARSAYEKALSVNAADVRARYNLAGVHTRLRDYPQAMGRIAEAMALDKTGEYRERLLQKQQEVVALQSRRHQQEYLLRINLVSKFPKEEPARDRE